ncbi:MAG: ATP-binding protein [Clostridiales bacterium]|nr:ATP-binding protein [Clostridiales bacterium]
MIRMEIACFLVLALMAVMYFTAKREKTQIHRVFSTILILSMIHLVLDGMTIYTVNHLESIPLWMNDVLHRLFLGTMEVIFYLVYHYIVLLVESESEDCLNISRLGTLLLGIVLLGVVFLPLYYVETENGNYSYGPTVYMVYVCIAIYLLLTIIMLIRHWKQIHVKKKIAVSIALGIEVVLTLYQMVRPVALVSGMGITLINLSFYLIMENPDVALVEQVREEKRKADEANAAKSIFLSNMSHEIRTPMNAIVGMAEILLRTDLTEEQREYLANIKSSGNALVSIVNDILDISKIEAGKMELVEDVYELRPMLSDIRMIIQNRIGDKPIELLYEIDENLPRKMYGDGLRIRQVIINLMNNAVKFTDEGYVKLSMRQEEKSEEEILLYVSVSDTGQGIREEDLQKLFGAFEQVDKKKNKGKEGTGLGLAISSQLIGMMGGKLQVTSEYGVGTEFFFTIRQKTVSIEIEEEGTAEGESMNFTAPEAKILIVDDNELNLKVAIGLLAPLKMQIDVAESGKKSLAMVQEKKYDIIFMDHLMPVMDGVETTECLRKMEGTYYKEVPVIALTANAMTEAQKVFAEAGMNGFVAKPIDMRQLCAVIQKWLPEELIIRQETNQEAAVDKGKMKNEELPEIEGIDINEGIKNTGSKEFFIELLGDFYKLIDLKSAKIEKCMADNLIKDYTIEVHALKSSSRMLGAMELSEDFRRLEQLGDAKDLEAIYKETPEVLAFYRSYKPILKPFGTMREIQKREAPTEEIVMYLQGIQEAIDGFDLDAVDAAFEKLEECRLPEICLAWMEELRAYIADVAMEQILQVTEKMINKLTEGQ